MSLTTDWLELRDRVAVVTGATGGIGKAIARALAAAGARVAILDLNAATCAEVAAEIGREGGTAFPFALDVGDQDRVRTAAEAVAASLGPASILVNAAAILRPGDLETISSADWQLTLQVNLTGYLTCSQAFGRSMLKRGEGAIVHVASIAASQPQAFSGAYSPGKAAVVMLSRQLAFEWGPRGVRSNSVSPGMIVTRLTESFYRVPGILEKRGAVVPVRRIGQPEDIANVTLFLASPRAGYVNGQDLVVDGGFNTTLMSHIPRPGFEN